MRRPRAALATITAAITLATIMAGAGPAGAISPTQVLVRRPVTSAGHVAAGFTVQSGAGQIDCSMDSDSSVAVDPGIFACGPDIEYPVACWHSAVTSRVFCYRDPFSKVVSRFSASAPATAVYPRSQLAPLGLILGDGSRCTLRDGGAWPIQTHHPNWNGAYSCTGSDFAVWGPASLASQGEINETNPTWTVYTGGPTSTLTKRVVVRAWFVGTQQV